MQVYVSKDGQQHGPYTVEQLRDYVQQGNFSGDDYACHDGQNWVTVAEVPGFVDSAQSPSAPNSSAPKKKKIILWSSIGGIATLLVAGLLIWLPGNEDDLAEDLAIFEQPEGLVDVFEGEHTIDDRCELTVGHHLEQFMDVVPHPPVGA